MSDQLALLPEPRPELRPGDVAAYARVKQAVPVGVKECCRAPAP